LRTGIKMETNPIYGLFTCGSLGLDKKLNSVTVKRSTKKKKVILIAVITFIYLFRFAAALIHCNTAGRRFAGRPYFWWHNLQIHF